MDKSNSSDIKLKVSRNKIIFIVAIILLVALIVSSTLKKGSDKLVLPDFTNDKNSKEIGQHILSANSWFTCPSQKDIQNWNHNFITNHGGRVGDKFTKEDDINLFKDNPLYWSCLVVNVENWLK
jgi:hypothetical protein